MDQLPGICVAGESCADPSSGRQNRSFARCAAAVRIKRLDSIGHQSILASSCRCSVTCGFLGSSSSACCNAARAAPDSPARRALAAGLNQCCDRVTARHFGRERVIRDSAGSECCRLLIIAHCLVKLFLLKQPGGFHEKLCGAAVVFRADSLFMFRGFRTRALLLSGLIYDRTWCGCRRLLRSRGGSHRG